MAAGDRTGWDLRGAVARRAIRAFTGKGGGTRTGLIRGDGVHRPKGVSGQASGPPWSERAELLKHVLESQLVDVVVVVEPVLLAAGKRDPTDFAELGPARRACMLNRAAS